MGIFGNMFDFNGDGNLDVFEQGAELAFLDDLMREDEKRKKKYSYDSYYEEGEEDDD